MKITFALPSEIEAQLRENVIRHDTAAVRRLLVEAVTPLVEALLRETPRELTDVEFEDIADQLAEDLAVCVGPHIAPLSDYAVSREGIYEDHP
jgi:antitoxin ParD1/3/4